MRVFLVGSAFCFAAIFCSAAAVSAADRARHVTVHASGSFQKYGMTDVDNAMRATLNAYPGYRADKDKIESGAGYGGGVRLWTSDRVFIRLEIPRIVASNSGCGPCAGQHYPVEVQVAGVALTT